MALSFAIPNTYTENTMKQGKNGKKMVQAYEQGGKFVGWRCRFQLNGFSYAKVWAGSEEEANGKAAEWKRQILSVMGEYERLLEVSNTIRTVNGGIISVRKPTGGNGEEDIQWLINVMTKPLEIVKAKASKTLGDVWGNYARERIDLPKKKIAYKACIRNVRIVKDTFLKALDSELPAPNDRDQWQDIFKKFRKEIDGSEYANSVKNIFIGYLGSFMKYCYNESLMENMPRRGQELIKRYPVEPNPKEIAADHLKTMWDSAHDVMRFNILCGLNFGFYAADIGQLKAENIDMVNGRVFGVREKTKNKRPVRYNFKMWDITKEYFIKRMEIQKTYATNKTPNLFTTKAGGEINSKPFALNMELLLKKAKTPIYSFASFRDTSAENMEKIDPALCDVFLRHVAGNKMKMHYIRGGGVSPSLDAAMGSLKGCYPFLGELPAIPKVRTEP